jgi:hypothetical protein
LRSRLARIAVRGSEVLAGICRSSKDLLKATEFRKIVSIRHEIVRDILRNCRCAHTVGIVRKAFNGATRRSIQSNHKVQNTTNAVRRRQDYRARNTKHPG